MVEPSSQSNAPLQIQKACPKSWAELTGDGKKRFCSECALHVHDGAQLTRVEAHALVVGASERVCMRLQYDASGAAIYSDSKPDQSKSARAPRKRSLRIAHWALSAAAGLLAACHGSISTPASNDPTAGTNAPVPPSKMGKVCSTLIGDVAVPQTLERLGEASVPYDPAPAPVPEQLPLHDGK